MRQRQRSINRNALIWLRRRRRIKQLIHQIGPMRAHQSQERQSVIRRAGQSKTNIRKLRSYEREFSAVKEQRAANNLAINELVVIECDISREGLFDETHSSS
jgi:hypothetical protein